MGRISTWDLPIENQNARSRRKERKREGKANLLEKLLLQRGHV
jgi:hypothetical protein